MPRLVGINHIAVEVADAEEMLAFFRRIFDDVTLRGSVANMTFLDLGDQFVALETVRRDPVNAGHFGLVVDDAAATLGRAQEAGARMVGRNDFLDPVGEPLAGRGLPRHPVHEGAAHPRGHGASQGSRSPSVRSPSYATRASRTDIVTLQPFAREGRRVEGAGIPVDVAATGRTTTLDVARAL